MSLNDALLPEFDHEMKVTRQLLERLPDGKFDWKPHPKSMTLGRLASHLAELPVWATNTVTLTELDIAPAGAPPSKPTILSSRAEILQRFDTNVSTARQAVSGATDAAWMVPWSLKTGGRVVLTLPRVAVLRSFVLSHTIHHRAQLGVYLRLNDVPLPGSYGPTADEMGM